MDNFTKVKTALNKTDADAWILVDYENRNSVLVSFLGKKMLTRKIFLVIPKTRKPFLICHSIDKVFLNDKKILNQFDLHVYHTWKEMLDIEKKDFANYKKVLMDVSEAGLLPRISLADFGSVQFIKDQGIVVASSGDLLQMFSAVYDEKAYALQLKADKLTLQIKDEAFAKIKELIEIKGQATEFEVQQYICDRFHEEGMVYDDPAIVAIGKNASDPHYGPDATHTSTIRKGDLVLIDMWAKMAVENSVYADITWMGYVGKRVPQMYERRFEVLHDAIDACLDFLSRELPRRRVEGYEVDDISRNVVEKAGFGEFFIHRTGHNIAVDVSPHGPGVNIDNYETHDTREIIDGITFSLEPGIYAPDFGMRSETNVYIKDRTPIVVAGRQEEIIPILK